MKGCYKLKKKKGLKIALIVIAVLVIIIGAGFTYLYFNGMSGISSATEPADGQIRVACIGDSITYGHGISNWPKNNYPAILQSLLGDDYHVNNYGVSSHAVQDDSDRPYTSLGQYQDSLDYDADYVVFMMGTNDSKPENWNGADSFKEDLLAILESYGDSEIILCTPASAFFLDGKTEGVTSHDIQPLVVDEIAEIVRDIADEKGYTLIDIHSFTADHSEWFAKDGVHPSNDGAAAIAEEIASVIKE